MRCSSSWAGGECERVVEDLIVPAPGNPMAVARTFLDQHYTAEGHRTHRDGGTPGPRGEVCVPAHRGSGVTACLYLDHQLSRAFQCRGEARSEGDWVEYIHTHMTPLYLPGWGGVRWDPLRGDGETGPPGCRLVGRGVRGALLLLAAVGYSRARGERESSEFNGEHDSAAADGGRDLDCSISPARS
jgi:hypothetical protein